MNCWLRFLTSNLGHQEVLQIAKHKDAKYLEQWPSINIPTFSSFAAAYLCNTLHFVCDVWWHSFAVSDDPGVERKLSRQRSFPMLDVNLSVLIIPLKRKPYHFTNTANATLSHGRSFWIEILSAWEIRPWRVLYSLALPRLEVRNN